jgi:hypothetical protein
MDPKGRELVTQATLVGGLSLALLVWIGSALWG